MLDLTNDMKELVELFNKHNVDYAICGGYAVSYYGYMRATLDFDILVNPNKDNSNRVMAALEEFGFGNAGLDAKIFSKEGTAIHLGAEPNAIDILTSISSKPTSTYFKKVANVTIGDLKLRMLGFNDLIEAQKLVNRTKDRLDVEELLALKKSE